jgi:hypothetical protein
VTLAWLWLQTYLSVAAILLVAYAAGRPLVRRAFAGPLVAPLSVLTGAGALSLAVCLLCWAHAFTRGAVAVVASAIVAAALSDHLRAGGGAGLSALSRLAPRLDGRLLLGAIVLCAVGAFTVLTLYPPGAAVPPPFGDDTSYHLPLAQSLVDHHGFHDEPTIRFWFFPLANEALLALPLMVFSDDRVAAALELCLLLATCWTLWAWFAGSGPKGRRAGWASALVLLGSPVVVVTSTVAFVDTWTLAYGAAAAVALAALVDGRARAPALAAGVAGFLVAQGGSGKYTGLILAAAMLAVALVLVRRGLLARVVVTAGAAGAALVILPWYLRTVHLTHGSPVYPYLRGVFGGAPEITTLGQGPVGGAVVPTAAPSARGVFAYLRHDIAVFIPGMQPGMGYGNALALTPLLGLGYLGLAGRSLARRPVFLATLAIATAFFAVWATHSFDPRYAMPVVGLWALAAGFATGWLDDALGDDLGPRTRRVLGPVLVVALLLPSLSVVIPALRDRGRPPTTTAARYRYLVANVPCYAGLAYLNHRFGGGYATLGVDCQKARHYARGRLVDIRRPRRLRLASGRCPSLGPELITGLRALGVSYVVSSANPRARGRGPCPGLQAALAGRTDVAVVFDRDHSRVYRIRA